MKKTVVFMVLIVLAVSAFGQKKDAGNPNIPDWIVGTWVDQEGEKLVFNANGSFVLNRSSGVFIVIEGVIFIRDEGSRYAEIGKYYLSDDKRTLLIQRGNPFHVVWYTKQ